VHSIDPVVADFRRKSFTVRFFKFFSYLLDNSFNNFQEIFFTFWKILRIKIYLQIQYIEFQHVK